jgi:translation initiation factor 1
VQNRCDTLARASRYGRSHEAELPGPLRVKVRREVAGRRGKVVTTVTDVLVDDAELKELPGKLKKRCGVGGSVKDGVI